VFDEPGVYPAAHAGPFCRGVAADPGKPEGLESRTGGVRAPPGRSGTGSRGM